MKNIKTFRLFVENITEDFLIPEKRTLIEDKLHIVKYLKNLKKLVKPNFDPSPNYHKSNGDCVRIITQLEIDEYVNYNMKYPVSIFSKPNRDSDIPDALEFPGRKLATIKSIFDMTGIWIEDIEDFIAGKLMSKVNDVWFAHENILNPELPWFDDSITKI